MSEQIDYSYNFNEFCLNLAQKRLTEDRVISLSDIQFDTLRLLVENPDQKLDKNYLSGEVCPTSKDGPNTIERAISDLREKLHDSWDHPKIIKTERGGYRFVAPVRKVRVVDSDEEALTQPAEVETEATGQDEEKTLAQTGEDGTQSPSPEAASISLKDSNDGVITFNVLWRNAGRVIQLIICIGITLTIIISIAGTNSWEPINLYVSIPQIFMLLAAIGYLPPGPKELPEVVQKATGYDEQSEWDDARYIAEVALRRYKMYWIGYLCTWVFLYFSLGFIETKNNQPNYVVGIAATFFNNLNTAMSLLCYNILNQPVEIKAGKREINDTSWILAGAALIVAFLLIEIFTLRVATLDAERERLLYGFTLISGIAGGVGLALFVGRLQSKFLGPSPPLVMTLYSYTAIQSLFIFLVGFPKGKQVFEQSTETVIGVMLINIALFLKCLLYLYMIYLFRSGRLLFYFVKVRHTYLNVEEEWPEFRKTLKQDS
jgi:DNA-binding winged helix-turn-helix (wHTH) protein